MNGYSTAASRLEAAVIFVMLGAKGANSVESEALYREIKNIALAFFRECVLRFILGELLGKSRRFVQFTGF